MLGMIPQGMSPGGMTPEGQQRSLPARNLSRHVMSQRNKPAKRDAVNKSAEERRLVRKALGAGGLARLPRQKRKLLPRILGRDQRSLKPC